MTWWRRHKVPDVKREDADRAQAAADERLRAARHQRAEAERLARELRDVRRRNRFAPLLLEALRGGH